MVLDNVNIFRSLLAESHSESGCSDDLRGGGDAGGTPFPYYLCSGNAVPFEKNQGWRKTRTGERYSQLPR